jgi:hypothetical protein
LRQVVISVSADFYQLTQVSHYQLVIHDDVAKHKIFDYNLQLLNLKLLQIFQLQYLVNQFYVRSNPFLYF